MLITGSYKALVPIEPDQLQITRVVKIAQVKITFKVNHKVRTN